ncbi:MAG: hypothetical protein ACLU62_10765 [Hydrogeniiclostridium sp.]
MILQTAANLKTNPAEKMQRAYVSYSCGGECRLSASENMTEEKSPADSQYASVQADIFCLSHSYSPGELLTYIVTLRNTGAFPLCSLEITDNLGAWAPQGVSLNPLSYEGPLRLYVEGCFVSCISPACISGESAVFSILYLAPGAEAALVYHMRVNEKAPLAAGSVITSTVGISAENLPETITASHTIPVRAFAPLQIEKAVFSPKTGDGAGQYKHVYTLFNPGLQPAERAVITDDIGASWDTRVISVFLNGQEIPPEEYCLRHGRLIFPAPGASRKITVPAAEICLTPEGSPEFRPGSLCVEAVVEK